MSIPAIGEIERLAFYIDNRNAIMSCPNGVCDIEIWLPLDKGKKGWKLSREEDGSITLQPSVKVKCQRNCHFKIKGGSIIPA